MYDLDVPVVGVLVLVEDVEEDVEEGAASRARCRLGQAAQRLLDHGRVLGVRRRRGGGGGIGGGGWRGGMLGGSCKWD